MSHRQPNAPPPSHLANSSAKFMPSDIFAPTTQNMIAPPPGPYSERAIYMRGMRSKVQLGRVVSTKFSARGWSNCLQHLPCRLSHTASEVYRPYPLRGPPKTPRQWMPYWNRTFLLNHLCVFTSFFDLRRFKTLLAVELAACCEKDLRSCSA